MIKSAQQSSIQNDIKYRSMSAGNVPSNEYLISTTVLTQNEPSVTLDVSNLVNIYRHLKICAVTRTNLNGAEDSMFVTFNGDTSSSYAWHFMFGNGTSTVYSSSGTSASGIYPFAVVGNTQAAGCFGVHLIDILDFSNINKNTTIRASVGYAGGTDRVAISSGLYNKTDAITSITLDPSGSDWLVGSRFSVYGVTA